MELFLTIYIFGSIGSVVFHIIVDETYKKDYDVITVLTTYIIIILFSWIGIFLTIIDTINEKNMVIKHYKEMEERIERLKKFEETLKAKLDEDSK